MFKVGILHKSFKKHDHRRCIKASVKALETYCKKSGFQFTKLRKRVLEILLEGHKAIGAYEVLDKLRFDGVSPQPPMAYRAINFLVTNGFAHKIEKLNAFIACEVPGIEHKPAFLICRICRLVSETENKSTHFQLRKEANNTNFNIENSVVEAVGVCPNCE